MAFDRTVTEIVADVRQYADAVDDDGFFTDTELTRRINESAKKLHTKLTRTLGLSYRAETFVAFTTPGLATILLENGAGDPIDMERIGTIDFLYDGKFKNIKIGHWSMREWEPAEWRPGAVYYLPRNWTSQVYNSELIFFPTPTKAEQVVIQYIPGWEDRSGSETIDLPEDWYRWVALDVAIQMRIKEDLSTTELRRERAELDTLIEASAPDLDAEQNHRIRDAEPESAGFGDEWISLEADW